ncbi:MAG: orotidine-5'-phosphate decarboxylase [Elusimicrobia bacterium]|nr:orotidine-5'-phosphate decarboxylase [Elusimicrobiota bacterium]
MSNPLILALDVSGKETKKVLEELSLGIDIFKIGSRLFTEVGPDCVNWVNKRDKKVFLDLKFHDIPLTVSESCRNAARMGVWGFTMHASGGSAMMRQAADAVKDESERLGVSKPYLFAVTVLTSFSDGDLNETGVSGSALDQVQRLAILAKQCGMDGVVASGNEIEPIRKVCDENFLLVVPGIRFESDGKKDDQKRTISPKEAMRLGANYLVVGRPILNQKDRQSAAQKILQEIR